MYPSNLSRISRNSLPCKGLVNTSAVIISVGRWVTENSPESMNCFIKKYRSFMCFVRSEHDFPFFAIVIVDVLSWYILANSTCTPTCAVQTRGFLADGPPLTAKQGSSEYLVYLVNQAMINAFNSVAGSTQGQYTIGWRLFKEFTSSHKVDPFLTIPLRPGTETVLTSSAYPTQWSPWPRSSNGYSS